MTSAFIPGLGAYVSGPNLVVEAARFADQAHGLAGQQRKYTGEPYIQHPAAVADLVAPVISGLDIHNGWMSDEIVAAAWLHDVVEDTAYRLFEIDDMFGHRVGVLVEWVTKISRPTDGNRSVRARIDRDYLAQAPGPAQTIKLADLIDNTESIVTRDPVFARVYLKEKDALLGVLTNGSPRLWDRARQQCDDGLRIVA